MTRLLALVGLLAVVVSVLSGGAAGAATADEDYDALVVRLTDTKGVATEIEDFGFLTGPNVVAAYLGDGELDLPLRKVRTLEIGEYVDRDRRAPATATMRSGKRVTLEIGFGELSRLLGGETEFGSFRIALLKIRRLEVVKAPGDVRP